MSMSKVWPTAVSGLASGALRSIPEPSMSTCRPGSETRTKMPWGGTAMRRVAEIRSGVAGVPLSPVMCDRSRLGGLCRGMRGAARPVTDSRSRLAASSARPAR